MTEELDQLLKNLKLRRMLDVYDEHLRAAEQAEKLLARLPRDEADESVDVKAVAREGVALHADLVRLDLHQARVGHAGGVVAHLEDDVDGAVVGAQADRDAARRAPQGALVMGGPLGVHDLCQVAPGIDDLAGDADAVRRRRRDRRAEREDQAAGQDRSARSFHGLPPSLCGVAPS